MKASRYLTHVKRLMDMEDGVKPFYERLAPLVRSPKLGPVLWQLPESFHRNDARLAAALGALPPGRDCCSGTRAGSTPPCTACSPTTASLS